MICIFKTFCIKCGNENIDWKRSDESAELISCFKCHALSETDTTLISVTSTESLRALQQK